MTKSAATTSSVGQGSNGAAALLTYREVGKILNVTDRTVWQLVKDGKLQAVRFGRTVRIDPADLRAFIERAKQGRDD